LKALALTFALCLALAASGCGGGGSSTGSTESSSAASGQTEASASAEAPPTTTKTKPKVKVPKGPPPKKLVVKEIEKGSGPKAKVGDELAVEYVGVNYRRGDQFDASWDRHKEPLLFELAEGSVIPGWVKGIKGMKVGGRRELIIPPSLAYGPEGRPPTIPPNETLIFVVDLLAVH
jgi:peptidylprolyl isomerase